MSPFSHATALPFGAVPSLQASNFETHVECVPRPRHWGCSSRTTKPAEMLLFYPGADTFHDIEMGGRHIHHLVWGILLLLLTGYGWMLEAGTGAPGSRTWAGRTMSMAYGVGAALT